MLNTYMLYKQLNRVNELDNTIKDLHQKLADLYAERSRIMSGASNAPESQIPFEAEITERLDPKAVYERLVDCWKTAGVKLPAYKSLSARLEKATAIVDHLQNENPQLEGKLNIVAVPPSKTLSKLLTSHSGMVFEFADDDMLDKTAAWSLVVIADRSLGLPIQSLESFLKGHEFQYKGYGCRGLGVNQLLAAELQGVQILSEEYWTLLLRDSTHVYEGSVPCATIRGEHVVVDTDKADCLLGSNYLLPAIEAV